MGPRDRPSSYPLAHGRLGAFALTFFALSAAAPLSAIIAVVPAAYAGGIPVVPLVLAGIGVILALFSVGYLAMARRSPIAGPLYCFVARGLGRPIGVGAAWVALISYNALQISLYGLVGAAAAPLLASWYGVSTPWWVVAAACWAIVALCGVVRIDFTGALLGLVVLATTTVITGFAVVDLLDPAGGRITWDTVDPTRFAGVDRPALGLLMVAGALAAVGFETTAVYGEEARRPRRAIARATYLTVAVLTVLYAGSAWAMSVAAGSDRVAAVAAERGPEFLFDLAAARLAPWAVTLGRGLLLAGLLVALISLHHTIARYLYALGRERVLPRWLGHTGRRSAAPWPASLVQSLVAAAALAACIGWRYDPTTGLSRRLGTAGGLGILLLLLASSVAALFFLNRHPNGENAWQRFLAPGLATVALGTLAYLASISLPALLGLAPADLTVWIVPATYGAAMLLGIVYGAAMRRTRPIDYAGIGLGGTAIVVSPTIPGQRVPGAHRPERVKDEPALEQRVGDATSGR